MSLWFYDKDNKISLNLNQDQIDIPPFENLVIDMSPLSMIKQAVTQAVTQSINQSVNSIVAPIKECLSVKKYLESKYNIFGHIGFVRKARELRSFVSQFDFLKEIKNPIEAYASFLRRLYEYFHTTKTDNVCVDPSQTDNNAIIAILNDKFKTEQNTQYKDDFLFQSLETYTNSLYGNEEDDIFMTASSMDFSNFSSRRESFSQTGGATLDEVQFLALYIQCVMSNGTYDAKRKTRDIKCWFKDRMICSGIKERNIKLYDVFTKALNSEQFSVNEVLVGTVLGKAKQMFTKTVNRIPLISGERAAAYKVASSCYLEIFEDKIKENDHLVILRKIAQLIFNDVLLDAIFLLYNFEYTKANDVQNIADYLRNAYEHEHQYDKYRKTFVITTEFVQFIELYYKNDMDKYYKAKTKTKAETKPEIDIKYFSSMIGKEVKLMSDHSKLIPLLIRSYTNAKLLSYLFENDFDNQTNTIQALDKIQTTCKQLYKNHIWAPITPAIFKSKNYEKTIKKHLSTLITIYAIFDDKESISKQVASSPNDGIKSLHSSFTSSVNSNSENSNSENSGFTNIFELE